MGGGGAIRAVAKVAGIGVFNSGIRGRLSENSVLNNGFDRKFLDHSFPKASRLAPHPVLGKVQQGTSEPLDDWELAGSEDGVFFLTGDDEKSRTVFGNPPTLEEAKEATAELKEAVEKSYLSLTVSPRNAILGEVSGLSLAPWLPNSRIVQTIKCENEMTKHAMQAFKFLSESQPLQNVVASIASDPNVWYAVLSNPALQDFLQSHTMDCSLHPLCPDVKESCVGGESLDDDDDKTPRIPELVEIWKNIKVMVVDMMNELSDFFQGLLGGHPSNTYSLAAFTSTSFSAKALGPSLMGLVVLVMMVVAYRRSAA